MNGWTLPEAVHLCTQVEAIAPNFGCHVALTGGVLYQYGEREDLDLLFYRIRQQPTINVDGLFAELARLGVKRLTGFKWVHKAEFNGKQIDCFFPEEEKCACTLPSNTTNPNPGKY